MTGPTPIEPLDDQHVIAGFTSGEPSLDQWLVQHARANQLAGFSRTYVTTDGRRVVGYLALSSFSILRTAAPRRAGRGGPGQIPAILLGRLAVDSSQQGRGLGSALLRHALEITLAASRTVGVRLLVVNAIHERAASFYRQYGFEPSPTNPLDLILTVADIDASARTRQR